MVHMSEQSIMTKRLTCPNSRAFDAVVTLALGFHDNMNLQQETKQRPIISLVNAFGDLVQP